VSVVFALRERASAVLIEYSTGFVPHEHAELGKHSHKSMSQKICAQHRSPRGQGGAVVLGEDEGAHSGDVRRCPAMSNPSAPMRKWGSSMLVYHHRHSCSCS
jgi:hypothetical protein